MLQVALVRFLVSSALCAVSGSTGSRGSLSISRYRKARIARFRAGDERVTLAGAG
jgi:hypothetical protein